jgi:predicted RNase H-like nuclease (RuvC/YqgF family)
MVEWIIALGAIAVILLACAVAMANRIDKMFEDIKKLEQLNADLIYSIKLLKVENKRLQNRVYVTPESHDVTRLKLEILQKQERIEALQVKLKRQHQLLNQKWGDSKCL